MAENSGNARPPAAHRKTMRQRAVAWLAWWATLMALWVMIDDSVRSGELLAGAGAAALAALGAELAAYQASVRLSVRPARPLAAEALRLPARLARDTVAVFAVLARTLASGGREAPRGEYAEIPADVPPGEAGQVLLTGIRSFTPDTFVVGADRDRGVLLVHRLAAPGGRR